MAEWKQGMLVRAERGREKGRLLCVVGQAENRVLLCDGKERPLSRPKAKNPKHLTAIGHVLNERQMQSNRALKQALKDFSEAIAYVKAGHD